MAELGTIAKNLGGTANKGKRTFTFKDRNSLDAFLKEANAYVSLADQAIDIIGKFSASGEIRKILAGIQMVDNEELNSQQRKISEIGEAMGVPVVWIDADSRLNGFHSKGVTFLNRKAGMSLQKTFWHEQFHWLRNNNDDLWRELLTYFKGKDAFSKKQIEAYQKKTGRYDLTSDEAVIEEMLADAFMDVSRRVPIMKELARDDRSLAQKLVAWIKDMMNRFVEMFHNPEGRLTTEQRDIFVEAFGKLARDMVDADGKKIFKTYDDGKTIRLADGSELAGVRLSTGKKKFSIDNSEKIGDNVIEEVFERAKQPRYLRIINDNMNYEEVVERLLEPENIAVSRALSLYEIRERNNDSTTIPRQKLKAFLQVADTRRRALKDERGRKTLHEILRQHGRIREGSNLERTLSGRDIQGIRLSDGTNRQSGIDVKILGEFGSLYEHAVVKELLQEISEESRKSVKASANLNNDTIKRSEKSASSMPKNKLSVSEKPSRTGNRKSTFFTVDSDLMDVSGHIPENGIPFIDNLWYKDEYAADPTDLSTVSPKVLRKGNATNHVLAVIDYLKDKGYDKFQIKTMSEYSDALMESMEEKGYVKALSKWRNEGDNVSYQILDTVFGGKEFVMSSEKDVDNSENIGDNESRETDPEIAKATERALFARYISANKRRELESGIKVDVARAKRAGTPIVRDSLRTINKMVDLFNEIPKKDSQRTNREMLATQIEYARRCFENEYSSDGRSEREDNGGYSSLGRGKASTYAGNLRDTSGQSAEASGKVQGEKAVIVDGERDDAKNFWRETFDREYKHQQDIINDGMNYEEVVERLLEPENIAVSRALSLYEVRERNNDSTTIPRMRLKEALKAVDIRRRALKDERGRKTLDEILRQHGRIREGSNLEKTLSGRDIQGVRLSDGTNRQSGIDVKIPGEFGSLYEHAVVKELLQEISEESRKSVKASANLNNDTIKRSEKSASSMPQNKLFVSEKPSRTGNRKSTFFTVDSDLMDVSGHIPENGIPFIDNLWYKDEYATDPTDVSTVSPKVLRKGNATNHVLAVIDYLKDKGYDKFQIKTMSEYSEALMESMEEKGYVKALSKWRNEGDNVSYQILKTRRSKDSTAGTKFSINASDNSTPSLAHRIKNILAGTPATAQAREQYRRKMARMIEDALGVKIRTGKLDVGRPENGTVVYKEKDKVIRSLHAYDWENILPMASGLMAERLGIVGKAADTTAAMRNYISTWILTGAPNNTSAEADTFHRAMQEHPHFADRMLAIREQFQEWADKSTQEQMRGTVQWTKEKSSTWKERKNLLYEELVEELAPVEDMVKQYEQETGEKLEASLNPMTAFRLLRGAHGRAITMIEGVGQSAVDGLKANFPNINFDGFKTLHTILDEIGALQNQEKQQDFASYCIAKHILDMHRKNRQNRLEQEKLEYQVEGMREQVKEDTQKAKKMKERLALYQGEMKELRRLERRIESNKNKIREAEKRIESLEGSIYETPKEFTEENCEKYIRYGREKYDQAQKALVHFSNTTAAILADSGVISNKRYQELLQSWPNYVPLFRVFEENKDIDFGDSMKRIAGSMRDFVNPLESIVHNTVEFVKKAEKNKAKSLLADFARCNGTGWLIEEVDNNSPNTETVITFYENGQRKYLETDPSIVKAVNNMDRRNSNAVLKFLHAITSVARACFTMASPEFAFRNIFRDYADAAVYNKFGFISPMDLARGFMHTFRRDNVYYEWLSSGAAQASAVSLDRNYTQEMIDKLSRSMAKRTKHGAKDVLLGAWTATCHLSPIKGIGQSYQGAKSIGSVILEGLQKGSEYSEYATRIAMYEKAKAGLNKGRTRQDAMNALIGAAFESRDLMDFSRHGKAGSFWNKLVPFANASIQGMNKFYRTMDWRNGNKKQAVRAFVRLAMSSILPAMLLFLMHHDDDWFKELPDWVKETHWVFKVGDTIIRIPKGSDVGVRLLSNAVEKGMADAFTHDRVKATEYFMPLYDSLPNFLPIAILPLLEASLNRSTFTDRNIVPQYQEKFTPKMQYGPYTTGMAKFLGEKLGIAPSKIDHVIAGYTGSIGMAPWKFLDVLAGDRQLDTSITELPLTRALTYMPYKNPKSVQKYYEELDEQTKLENEFKMTHKRLEGFDPALLQRLKDSKKQMSVLSKQERDLINNPNLTMDERKRRQFVIQQRRIRLVERIIK